jgi:hypothetical protein
MNLPKAENSNEEVPRGNAIDRINQGAGMPGHGGHGNAASSQDSTKVDTIAGRADDADKADGSLSSSSSQFSSAAPRGDDDAADGAGWGVAVGGDPQDGSEDGEQDDAFSLSHYKDSIHRVRKIVAKELYRMTQEERTEILEEIHGVRSSAPSETPERIQAALRQLQIEIDRVPIPERPAYQQAHAHDSHYVLRDDDFRLQFLRTHRMNAQRASAAFLHHLELLFRYFGRPGLLRPLRYDDLGKAERDLLSTGCVQLLPSRDVAGRRVLIHMHNAGSPKRMPLPPPYSMNKVFLYVYAAVARDVETQRNGVVCVSTAPETVNFEQWEGDDEESTEPWRSMAELLRRATPFRFVAIHLLVPDTHAFPSIVEGVILIMFGRENCVRSRVHSGA